MACTQNSKPEIDQLRSCSGYHGIRQVILTHRNSLSCHHEACRHRVLQNSLSFRAVLEFRRAILCSIHLGQHNSNNETIKIYREVAAKAN